MKLLLSILFLAGSVAIADDINSNNTIVIKPQGCGNSCHKKVRTIIIKQIVEKKVIVEKPVTKVVVVTKTVVRTVKRKNRISLLGGAGPTSFTQPSINQVNLVTGPVGGVQYQRNVTDTVSLGVQVQTNQTILGIVGFDF